MNKIIKYSAIALVAVLAIYGVVKFFSGSVQTAGDATTGFPNGISVGGGTYASTTAMYVQGTSIFNGGTSIGSLATSFANINGGTCYIKAYATTIAASSTATVDCQATAAVDASTGRIGAALYGVQNNDKIVASLSTTTSGTAGVGSLDLIGVSASTTNGYVTMIIANTSGATYTWPTSGTATGTASFFSFR